VFVGIDRISVPVVDAVARRFRVSVVRTLSPATNFTPPGFVAVAVGVGVAVDVGVRVCVGVEVMVGVPVSVGVDVGPVGVAVGVPTSGITWISAMPPSCADRGVGLVNVNRM
jgi:hypothetical protein